MVNEELRVNEARLDDLENLDHQATQGNPEEVDHKDHLDQLDPREREESVDHQVHLDKMHNLVNLCNTLKMVLIWAMILKF